MSSTNYTVDFDSLNSGGDDISSSTNYQMRDTIGEQATGFGSSTNFGLQAGYRQAESLTNLSFSLGTQEDGTQTTFSAFSDVSKTVTVGSVAGYSVGNFIGVVENQGLSQIIAIGRIVSIVATTITVDQWDGAPGSVSAVPAGGDDFVYRLEGSAAQLGTLTVATGETSLTHTDVSTDASSGYSVSVTSDGTLRSSLPASIADVSDGTVTIGSEEYGGRVSGAFATVTSTSSDFPITTTAFEIQESTTTATNQRVGLIYKAAISSSTPGGSYAQLVFYTVTGNF
ncbi:MAG: hypothetical protein ABIO72_03120 [Patescibacteria group bacterium]